MPIPQHFVQIDEEGKAVSNELIVQNISSGQEILGNLKLHEGGTLVSTFGDTPVIVEAFDEPYVAQQVAVTNGVWAIQTPYDLHFDFVLKSLSLDEWDRFHGYTTTGIPFVLSRKAQAQFFNLLEDYDDDSITFNGENFVVPSYWVPEKDVEREHYWSEIYRKEESPGWNLNEPAEALKDMLPRLKLTRSRVLVLGCGEGHDAAYFASMGHIVTAVDISPEAISRAKAKYSEYQNLQFVEADLFKLPESYNNSFDIIFEHTCYCAINPTLRKSLVRAWNRLLTDTGYLMGVFFAFEKRQGPPFGGTEWELRQRLKDSYLPVFWGRWKQSLPRRQGKELFIYCKKK